MGAARAVPVGAADCAVRHWLCYHTVLLHQGREAAANPVAARRLDGFCFVLHYLLLMAQQLRSKAGLGCRSPLSIFFVPGTCKLSQLRSERLARFQQKHNTKLMHVRCAFVAFTSVRRARGDFWRVSLRQR